MAVGLEVYREVTIFHGLEIRAVFLVLNYFLPDLRGSCPVRQHISSLVDKSKGLRHGEWRLYWDVMNLIWLNSAEVNLFVSETSIHCSGSPSHFQQPWGWMPSCRCGQGCACMLCHRLLQTLTQLTAILF